MDDDQTQPVPIIRLDASRITRWLMIVAVIFAVAAVVMAFLDAEESDSLAGEVLDSLQRLFNPDLEANLATWFATGLLLAGALLTALVAKAKGDADDPLRYHWVGLFMVILFMSIDEAAQIHEMLIKPTQQLLGVSRSVGWVWTLPALVVVSVFVVMSLRLLSAQSQRTRRLMILAFGLFVFGAFGVETVGSILFGSDRRLGSELAATVEELFEMSGAVVFIHAMLGLLALLKANVSFEDTTQ
jgi:hypothetical protein